MVLNRVHAQVSNFVEGPAADPPGELLIPGRDRLYVTGALDLSVEPLVLEYLGGANNSEASRVASLEGSHQVQLRTRGEHLVDHLSLLLLVVNVGGPGSLQDRGQLSTVAERKAQAVGEGNKVSLATTSEVAFGARLVLTRRWQEEDIVLVSGGLGIVVEVVDNKTSSLGGDVDIKLEEDGVESGRDGGRCAQGKENVSAGVDKVENLLRRQVGTEA